MTLDLIRWSSAGQNHVTMAVVRSKVCPLAYCLRAALCDGSSSNHVFNCVHSGLQLTGPAQLSTSRSCYRLLEHGHRASVSHGGPVIISKLALVPDYTALWQSHTCVTVTFLPKVVLDSAAACIEPAIYSRKSSALTAAPPRWCKGTGSKEVYVCGTTNMVDNMRIRNVGIF